MSKRPAYLNMYEVIKREIIEGDLSVNEFLPPEQELEKRFNVSRTTVRKAIEMLTREGLVYVKQGRGTQVMNPKTRQNLNLVNSISETLRRKGHKVSTKSMYIDFTSASVRLAEDLNIEQGAKVVRIQRIQLADEKPIAVMRNYLIPDMVPGIENYLNKFTSLYEFLEERYNINIDSAYDRITAKCADFEEATMLDVPVGSAILSMRRVCFEAGKPVVADQLSIVGDKYELDVNMVGRNKEIT